MKPPVIPKPARTARRSPAPLAAVMASGLLFALAPIAAAQTGCPQGARAGWISRVEGRLSDAVVIRPGVGRLNAEPLMPICPGDSVESNGAAIIHVRLYGELEERDVRDQPSRIVVTESRANTARNMLDMFLDHILPDLDRANGHVRMRGGEFESDPELNSGALHFLTPGLRTGTARVSLTETPTGFAFMWQGGAGPVDVTLLDDAGAIRYYNVGARAHLHNASTLELREGRWRVRVRDSAGAEIEGTFTVLATPAPTPPDWNDDTWDESVRVLWLARCHGEQWGLAALQKVARREGGRLSNAIMYDLLRQYSRDPATGECPAQP